MKQIFLAFLALIFVIVIGTLAVGLPFAGNSNGSFVINAASKKTDISLGAEKDLSLLSKKIEWTPDGHITYVTFGNGTKRYFISGNQKTYTVDTSASQSLNEALASNVQVRENFGPDETILYRNNYSTINSVIQTDPRNLNHLMAFTQNEGQAKKADGTFDTANFTSTIGLLESYDGGNTWKDFGPVIKGDDYIDPGTKISGAGEPSAVVNNGYIYVYFVDWAAGVKVNHADQIYLARTKIGPTGGLGAFEYLTENGFTEDASSLKPVILADANTGYAALPSVSYNKYLGEYLAIYETNIGFFQATSSDGITWENNKLFLSYEKPLSQRQTGDTWISYPTLLSDQTEKTDGSTKNTGNLYYGKGTWPNSAHQLTVKSFEFK